MRKILLALIIIPALFAVGWTVIGTNIWGIRFGPSTYVAPTDGYAIQYQSSTKTYELKAGGGGGGGVTTFTPGPGISGAIVGTTLGVSNTGVTAINAGTNITLTGPSGTPTVTAAGPIAGTGISVAGTTVTNTGLLGIIAGTNVTLTGPSNNPTVSATAGGGGVSSVTAGAGISVGTSGGTVTVTNTGSVNAGTNITVTGPSTNPTVSAPAFGTTAGTSFQGNDRSPPLDTWSATTDITALNSSTSAHGLLPKLPGGTTTFLRADGAFGTPAGTGVTGLNSGTNITLTGPSTNPTVTAASLLTTNNGGASTSTTTINCGVGPIYFSWAGPIATLNTTSTGTGTTLVLATSPTITTPTLTLGSDATGDTWYRGAGGGMTRLAIGAGGAISVVSSGVPAWLSVGGNSTVLQVSSGGVLQYSTVTNAMIVASAGIPYSKLILTTSIVDGDVAAANKDGTAGTPSLRTLGTGPAQSCAGNDSRLSDSRAPSGTAGGTLSGTFPNPAVKFRIALMPGATEVTGATSDPLLVGTKGTNSSWSYLAYNDTTVMDGRWVVGGSIVNDYAGGAITLRIRWYATATTGNVVWTVKTLSRAAGTVMDTAYDATNAHTITTATAGTTLQLVNSDITWTPIAGELTAASLYMIQVERTASSGSDTMTGDANVVSATVTEN